MLKIDFRYFLDVFATLATYSQRRVPWSNLLGHVGDLPIRSTKPLTRLSALLFGLVNKLISNSYVVSKSRLLCRRAPVVLKALYYRHSTGDHRSRLFVE